MFTGLLAILVVVLRFGPDTDVIRALRRVLVERPVDFALRCDRKTLLTGLFLALLLLGGGEFMILFGPEFLSWYAANLAVYADALAVSALLALRSRLRPVAIQVRAAFASVRRPAFGRGSRPRALRQPKPRPAPTSNDNDPDGGQIRAAA